MSASVEICFYLTAILICMYTANASLETENNEVNVSKCSAIKFLKCDYEILSAVRISLFFFFNVPFYGTAVNGS